MSLPSGKCNTNCNTYNPFNQLIVLAEDFQVLASWSKKEVSLFYSSLRCGVCLDAIPVTVSFAVTLCDQCENGNRVFNVSKANVMQ